LTVASLITDTLESVMHLVGVPVLEEATDVSREAWAQ